MFGTDDEYLHCLILMMNIYTMFDTDDEVTRVS